MPTKRWQMKNTRSERNRIQIIKDTFSYLENQDYTLDRSAIIAITNVKGEMTYIDSKFCKISKYSRKELK